MYPPLYTGPDRVPIGWRYTAGIGHSSFGGLEHAFDSPHRYRPDTGEPRGEVKAKLVAEMAWDADYRRAAALASPRERICVSAATRRYGDAEE